MPIPPDGSKYSLWSKRSLLSIGSRNSVLSIGSVGSRLSIGSAGSFLSIGCAGSAFSVFSAASFASLASFRGARTWGGPAGLKGSSKDLQRRGTRHRPRRRQGAGCSSL
jgi:hypothetical protein